MLYCLSERRCIQLKLEEFAYDIGIEKSKTALAQDMPEEHIHSQYELYFLLSGERRYFIDGEIYNVSPGNLVIVPRDTIHRTMALNRKGYDRYVLYFTEESLGGLREELGEKEFLRLISLGCVQLPAEQIPPVRERLERIYAEQQLGDPFSSAMMRSVLREILLTALRHGVKKNCALSEGADKIQHVARYISENFTEPLTLDDAARMACMEKTYFSKRFKALTGFNFSSYITQLRLSAARQLLLNTEMNISEIAAQAGFSGSNYFGDVFLRVYGLSPTEYRKQRKER